MFFHTPSTHNLTNISRLTAHIHLRHDFTCEPIPSPSSKGEALGMQNIPQKPQEVEQGAGNGCIPSEQEILRLSALLYLQDPEKLNGFLKYLENVHNLLVVGSQEGSLIITVQCSSLQILEELWEDYRTGHLNEIAQQFLVTEDILRAFSQIEVKLQTTIEKKEYMACKEYFMQQSGECERMQFNHTYYPCH